MRRGIVRFSTPIGQRAGVFSSPFSSGAGGRGRGRGRASGVDPHFNFDKTAPGKPTSQDKYNQQQDNNSDDSVLGGGGAGHPTRPDQREFGRKVPDFIQRMEDKEKLSGGNDDFVVNRGSKGDESEVRAGLMNVLAAAGAGAGRGKIDEFSSGVGVTKQENRFVKARQKSVGSGENVSVRTPSKNLSQEDARKNAVDILSRGDGGSYGGGGGDRGERVMESGGRGGGRGFRGRGGRGFRGRGGRGRFGGRGERQQADNDDDDDDDGLYLGDAADGEKLAQRIGPENMNKLVEGFEEMSENVLPSLEQDAFVDAMHVNYAIECEPEYLFGDFESNPDIDEKPPMSLREALDKAKPFLMAYENIQSHEEWEEAVEDAMKQVPLMKQIVDYYSGPVRVTAKQQMEELERVAKTLPESAPDSVKRFTNRAVLSLQSNPGWGFDKKCQFMDKLVREVSQQYK